MITFENDFLGKLYNASFYYKCCFTLNALVENLMSEKMENCEQQICFYYLLILNNEMRCPPNLISEKEAEAVFCAIS